MRCIFVSDFQGDDNKYRKLFTVIRDQAPSAVFLGGDLLPTIRSLSGEGDEFISDTLARGFAELRNDLGQVYPDVFVILGNDDPRVYEKELQDRAYHSLWKYIHFKRATLGRFTVVGYACIPPSPFRLKDWERYDVSRYTDPGSVSPEKGARTIEPPGRRTRYRTIAQDLENLAKDQDLAAAIMLFHTPPYQTNLDRAALDGKMIDHVPIDPHIGSIAVRRFIEEKQPLLTLHGHVHESARITGSWHDKIGRTHMLTAAHDGPELAVVEFDPENLGGASRRLV